MAKSSTIFAPGNGNAPVMISYRITPRAYTSHLSVAQADFAANPLGGHVRRCAQIALRSRVRPLERQLAKIEHPHLTVFTKEDVIWLEVTVHKALLVSKLKRLGQFRDERRPPRGTECGRRSATSAQASPRRRTA